MHTLPDAPKMTMACHVCLQVLTPEQDLWSTNQFSLEFWYTQQIGRSKLLVQDCQDADLVYIPLTTQWGGCGYEDISGKFAEFTANLNTYLPFLNEKPHFMALARVFMWTGLNLDAYTEAGITFMTVEGDLSRHFIKVPYPGLYHHHDGLHDNRFIRNAITQKKNRMAFECFGLRYPFREALYKACTSYPNDCQHSMADLTGEHANRNALQFFTNASRAWFCLQPPGDSFTRRSTFDCLQAGSIPVFFDSTAIAHFPWSDVIDPYGMVFLSPDDVQQLFNVSLPAIPVADRQTHLNRIAQVAHLYQYALTPHSGLIRWDNVHKIDHWDDAFTFGLKALIRNLQTDNRLPLGLDIKHNAN